MSRLPRWLRYWLSRSGPCAIRLHRICFMNYTECNCSCHHHPKPKEAD